MSSTPKKKVSASVPHTTHQSSAPSSAASKRQVTAADAVHVQELRQKIADLVQKEPQKAAVLVSDWINRPSQRAKTG